MRDSISNLLSAFAFVCFCVAALPHRALAGDDATAPRTAEKQEPLAASIQRTIIKRTEDGEESVRVESEIVFRDAEGRMRNEADGVVVLREPGGGAPVMLYPSQRKAIDLSKPLPQEDMSERKQWFLRESRKATARTRSSAPQTGKLEPLSQERISLGSQEISGTMCEGERWVMVLPAWGPIQESYEVSVETWKERGTGRIVRRIQSDTVNNETVVSDYSYMDPDRVLTPELFEVPKDYDRTN